ncbi:MAG: hypothetical protein HYU73_03330 [Betaproteobacteria bacterium]|nr:hypothetical protein [Betaproteobacteria bacterium]
MGKARRRHIAAGLGVDYAHTPDALGNILRSLRPHVGRNTRSILGFLGRAAK